MAKHLSDHEIEILHRVYPTEGSLGVHKLLPHRPMRSIKVIAHRRGLKTIVGTGPASEFKYDEIIAALVADRRIVKRAMFRVGCSEYTVRRAITRYRSEERATVEARIAERRSRSAQPQPAEAA